MGDGAEEALLKLSEAWLQERLSAVPAASSSQPSTPIHEQRIELGNATNSGVQSQMEGSHITDSSFALSASPCAPHNPRSQWRSEPTPSQGSPILTPPPLVSSSARSPEHSLAEP